ncbi:hypothetical protein AB0F81_32945 [Actinoplanes sp. NPDC024001]|uniref:hypothetical protein n=1 Tax=Actinoplanes sp. NPDC024001 TaxID=3154598 RepID=UPI00340CB7E4
MTVPGRIAYFLALIVLGILGFVVQPDFWVGAVIAAATMIAVSLFDVGLARRRRRAT